MSDDDDIRRAAEALKKAKEKEREAALSSSNGFLKFLEKLGLRVLANAIYDFIKGEGWIFVKCLIKSWLGTDDLDPDCY